MGAANTSVWSNPTKIDIGRVLAAANGRGVTAGELQRSLGTHQSNLKKIAEELVAAGVLKSIKPPRSSGRPGRPAQDAFTFADGERERFEDLLEDLEEPPGPLGQGSQLVFVDVQERGHALWSLLARKGVATGTRAVRQMEGERTELLFEFKGPTAVDDAMDLMEVLHAAELKARRQHVSKASSLGELRRTAQRRREQVATTREHFSSDED